MRHGGNVWEGERPDAWLDFSANLRPEGPPEWVTQTLMAAVRDARYYPDRSMTAARRGLAAYLGVHEAQVLPTAGGAAAIDLLLSLQAGTVYTWPVTFGEYAERAHARNRRAGVWNGHCAPGDTVFLCNPNNPTGHALGRDEMLRVGERVLAQGGTLAVDEAFIDYCAGNTVRHDVREGISVVGSLTKTLCIPGVRLGYVCAAPEVIQRLEALSVTWSLNTFAAAVAAALPRHLSEMQADADRNPPRREHLSKLLRGLGARVEPSQSNFLLADFGRDMTACVRALKSQGILVRTCASFGLPPSCLRVAVKTEAEHEQLIEALRKGLETSDAR